MLSRLFTVPSAHTISSDRLITLEGCSISCRQAANIRNKGQYTFHYQRLPTFEEGCTTTLTYKSNCMVMSIELYRTRKKGSQSIMTIQTTFCQYTSMIDLEISSGSFEFTSGSILILDLFLSIMQIRVPKSFQLFMSCVEDKGSGVRGIDCTSKTVLQYDAKEEWSWTF